MIKLMTPDKYAQYDGDFCPCCRSKAIKRYQGNQRVSKPDLGFNLVIEAHCLECESVWHELYALVWRVVGYDELDDRRID